MSGTEVLRILLKYTAFLFKINPDVLSRVSKEVRKYLIHYSNRKMLRMLDHQRLHVLRMLWSLRMYRIALDTSVMGSGKTYTTSFIAKKLDKPLVVFGPALTEKGWNTAADMFGVKLTFFTYSVFQRKDKPYVTVKKINDVNVATSTKEWKDKCRKGLILVLDESQNLKNKSDRTLCVTALSRTVSDSSSSNIICLSATPFDKPEHTSNLMKIFGVIRSPRLSRCEFGVTIYEGLRELLDYCRRINPDKMVTYIPCKSDTLAYGLVIRYVKPRIFWSMPPPNKPFKADIANLFCKIDEKGAQRVAQGVEKMRVAMRNMNNNDILIRSQAMGMLSSGLMDIENGKSSLFIRLAKERLREENSQVIIMLNYRETVSRVKSSLEKYNPLVLNGLTKVKERRNILDLFQMDDSHRVLITNINMTSSGIDLDDRVGNAPRFMLLSPSYYTINLHQACGRIDRVTTKSRPNIRYVYIKEQREEMHLLHKLAEKSGVIQSTLEEKVNLPGDHRCIVEE